MKAKEPTEVFLINRAYELMGEKLRWDTDKVNWLMDTCKIERGAVAAYLRVTDNQFNRWMKANRFPKMACLLLYQLAVARGFYTAWPQAPTEKKDDD